MIGGGATALGGARAATGKRPPFAAIALGGTARAATATKRPFAATTARVWGRGPGGGGGGGGAPPLPLSAPLLQAVRVAKSEAARRGTMFCDTSHLLLAVAAQPGSAAAELLAAAGWSAGPELWASTAPGRRAGGTTRREQEQAEADALAAASSALSPADVDMAPDARAVLVAAAAAARAAGAPAVGSAAVLLALLAAVDEARARDRKLLRREVEAASDALWGKQSPRTAAAQRLLAEEQARRRGRGGEDDEGGGEGAADDADDDDDERVSAAEKAARAVMRGERTLAVAAATLESLGGKMGEDGWNASERPSKAAPSSSLLPAAGAPPAPPAPPAAALPPPRPPRPPPRMGIACAPRGGPVIGTAAGGGGGRRPGGKGGRERSEDDGAGDAPNAGGGGVEGPAPCNDTAGHLCDEAVPAGAGRGAVGAIGREAATSAAGAGVEGGCAAVGGSAAGAVVAAGNAGPAPTPLADDDTCSTSLYSYDAATSTNPSRLATIRAPISSKNKSKRPSLRSRGSQGVFVGESARVAACTPATSAPPA